MSPSSVTDPGKWAGNEVVQVYLKFPPIRVNRSGPLARLWRIRLAVGARPRRTQFVLERGDFTTW